MNHGYRIALLVLVFAVVGCSPDKPAPKRPPSQPSPSQPAPSPQSAAAPAVHVNATGADSVSEELQQMWPIWKVEDLEINKGCGKVVVQYTHELNLRPKYYKGKMPLTYTSKQPISGTGMGGPDVFYAHEFEEFSNYFVYDRMNLTGIVTVNNSKTMIAEAKLEWQTDPKSGFYRPRMEEFHYSGGSLVFHCKSEIDYDTGTKISESGQSGSKRTDYFFVLPFGLNAH